MSKRAVAPVVRCGVLTLGAAATGKTAIIRRRKHTTYSSDPSQSHLLASFGAAFNASYEPTIGVELHHNLPHSGAAPARLYTRNDGTGNACRVVCSVYDLSGSTVFAKVRSEFFAHYSALMFVFDATNRDSFTALNDWYADAVRLTQDKQLSDANAHPFSTKIRGIVVASKIDKPDSTTTSGAAAAAAAASATDGKARAVSEAEGRDWATTHELSYIECSAKTGYNITALFDQLVIHHTRAAARRAAAAVSVAHAVTCVEQVLIASNTSGTVANSNLSPYTPLNASATPTAGGAGIPSTPSSAAASSSARVAPDKMSVLELKKELTALGVDTSDVLEKKELVARYIMALKGGGKYSMNVGGSASTPTAAAVAAASTSPNSKDGSGGGYTKEEQKTVERVSAELELWTAGRDIRSMLNDILELNASSPDYLKVSSSFEAVQKQYRKTLLRIHPDKTSRADFAAHYRTTELFKIVNEKWHAFQRFVHAQSGAGAASTPTSAAAATAAAATPTTPSSKKPTATRQSAASIGSFSTAAFARNWRNT